VRDFHRFTSSGADDFAKITHGGIEMGAHPKPARLTAPVVEGICIIFEKSAYST
jgi:hypothetical protein